VSEYRCARTTGSTVFLTFITYQRDKLFSVLDNIAKLRQACAVVVAEKPFTIDAAVILPEHIHFLWTLPPGDRDYSYRVGRIKVLFTRALRGGRIIYQMMSANRGRNVGKVMFGNGDFMSIRFEMRWIFANIWIIYISIRSSMGW
jgi:putative transposase